jgi:hypothetical protein
MAGAKFRVIPELGIIPIEAREPGRRAHLGRFATKFMGALGATQHLASPFPGMDLWVEFERCIDSRVFSGQLLFNRIPLSRDGHVSSAAGDYPYSVASRI